MDGPGEVMLSLKLPYFLLEAGNRRNLPLQLGLLKGKVPGTVPGTGHCPVMLVLAILNPPLMCFLGPTEAKLLPALT